jgi:hypothetical protein
VTRDIDLGPVIASDLNLAITFAYITKPAVLRTVTVDTVYGDIDPLPAYFRGHDSDTGQRRAFATDRAVEVPGLADITLFPWFVGQAVRQAQGLPILRPPRNYSLRRPVEVVWIDYGGGEHHDRGAIVGARFDYAWDGAFLKLQYERPTGAGPRVMNLKVGDGGYGCAIRCMIDLSTSLPVDDPLGWLDLLDASAAAEA